MNFRGANGATLAVSGKAWGQRLWVEVVGRRHGLVKQNRSFEYLAEVLLSAADIQRATHETVEGLYRN